MLFTGVEIHGSYSALGFGEAARLHALVHTAAAFAMLVFIIAHVYMATMGPKLISLIKPTVTGHEDLEDNR